MSLVSKSACGLEASCRRPFQAARCRGVVTVRASASQHRDMLALTCATVMSAISLSVAPASLADVRLPPLDSDPNRCERGYTGNTIGQANAVSDKTLDLRKCVYAGKSLVAKVLAGALMSDADLSGTNMQEVVLTKAYAVGANFTGANLTNGVIDRVDFDRANLSGVNFTNAVITGASFEGADLSNTTFEDALIGSQDAKKLCANPTLVGESRLQVGCRT